MLMECLSIGRSISLPSLSVAAAKHSGRTTGAYSRIRRQFKLPIGKFEGVEEGLGNIAGNTYMMDAARISTAQMVDNGEKPSIPSAIIKYHLTEKMRKAVNDAMDIQAGKSIINGPKNILSSVYQGIPIAITVEGANIMTRNLIIFGQGGVRAHPYLLPEIMAAAQDDKKKAAKDLTALIFRHVASVIMNSGRSLWFGMSGGAFSARPTKTKETKKYYKRINRMCAAFNVTANATFAMIGGGLKRKERISARLGDVLSNLYLASSTLKHYETRGAQKDEQHLMEWACETALHDAETALSELLDNYPNKFVAAILRVVTMPFGRLHKKPNDRLSHKVAQALMEPGELRDKLTSGIYTSMDPNDPVGELEDALLKVIAAEPLEKKQAIALRNGQADPLTDAERKIIADAEDARQRVIAVDHYLPEKESNAFNSADKAAATKTAPKKAAAKRAPKPAA
jgi:acyl-CoA dehydrogenase